jgi:hypothetical protein
MRNGGLSYLEIPATNPTQSAAFYAKVLGWNIHGEDPAAPKFIDQSRSLIGRWTAGRAAPREPGMLPYIYVNQINDVLKRVVENGGQIVKPITPEGNLWIATFRDPAGNILGLWQVAD